MSKRIQRDANGQFASGQSGNPDGARLRKPRELLTLDDMNRIKLEVAGEIVARRKGKPVTRYENVYRSLLTGDSPSRLAKKDFLEGSQSATYHFARLGRQAPDKKPRS
jgi:hypothetical protein